MVDAKGFARGFALFVGILFFLYFFLVSLDLMGNAFKIIAGDTAGSLFDSVSNPIAGLMVGILATVLVQSSSTTTSVIVSAVGAGVLPVTTAIPMVFGANIGTSVTNTIVSMGFIADREQYRRGFAGATVHDMFNYLNVCFWLPLEIIVNAARDGQGGLLFLISDAIVRNADVKKDDKWEGPLKIITAAVSKAIIDPDKDVTKDFAVGRPGVEQCPRYCEFSKCRRKFNQKRCFDAFKDTMPDRLKGINATYNGETDCRAGDKKAKAVFQYCINATAVDEDILTAAQAHYDAFKINKGGVFYENHGWQQEAGWITLIMSLIMLVICLVGLVKLLGIAVRGASEKALKKALNMNGYLAILVGCGVTIFVQSSSITTSTLTPLVAIGTLSLEGMLPLTLGANIGTTVTGLLAALVGGSILGLQIAVVHVLFNVFGVILFYPIPAIRAIPLGAARRLGDLAATYKVFPLLYIIFLFLVYPGFFLGLSVGFEAGTTGATVGAVFGLIGFIILHALFFYWYWRVGGEAFMRSRFGHDDVKKGGPESDRKNSDSNSSDSGEYEKSEADPDSSFAFKRPAENAQDTTQSETVKPATIVVET